MDTYVVVVYCSTNDDGADTPEVSVRAFETWINVSIPRVHRNVSPVPTPNTPVLETYESFRKTLRVPGSR